MTAVTTEYPITLYRYGEQKEIKNNGEEAKARIEGFCERYTYQEYPKALYRDGQRVEVTHDSIEKLGSGGCRVVKNKAEEDAARKDGYRMLHEPAPEVQDVEEVVDDAKGKAKVRKAA